MLLTIAGLATSFNDRSAFVGEQGIAATVESHERPVSPRDVRRG
ncbi:hypothetical protein EV696_11313 [Permianibacter aggregans]|uniref:Uncharacterized protein n=1 Tax=Permianibacter aggregans TaxID=1510150 RepID=A0A4R6UJ17_9GAMM|nr:hypothetical protein EV696_11313 [Permianibacter aggregans]